MKEEYIPRSAVLSRTHDIHVKSKAGDVDYSHRCIDPSDVEAIPAADVRPVVRGKWGRIDYEPFGHDYRCSLCGCKNDRASLYCPDCGAVMGKLNARRLYAIDPREKK